MGLRGYLELGRKGDREQLPMLSRVPLGMVRMFCSDSDEMAGQPWEHSKNHCFVHLKKNGFYGM